MSLLTTLAYAITAAVRPRVRDVEIAALQAKIDELRREFNEALPRIERQRDDWQALAMQYRDALFQRPAPAQPLQDYSMRQQTNALAHQLTIQNGLYLGQQLGQIGMQNFGQALDEYVRNCTPGRHELLTRNGH